MSTDIKKGFSKLRPALLLALLQNVMAKLLGNIFFPTPPIDQATLGHLATDFADSIAKATQGTPSARAARDAKAVEVRAALSTTANYVRLESAGNAEKLSSSGFDMAKVPAPIGPINTPLMKLAQMTGIGGEVEALWTRIPGAHSYQLLRTETDPALIGTVWTPVASTTKVRYKATGLVPYKAYWFAVQALGTDGPSAISDPMIGRAA